MTLYSRIANDGKNTCIRSVSEEDWFGTALGRHRTRSFGATASVCVDARRAFVFASLFVYVFSFQLRGTDAQTLAQDSNLGAELQRGHAALKENDQAKAA